LVEELLREIKNRFQPDQVILLLCQPDLLERFFPEISQESGPIGEKTWIVPFPAETGHSICGDSAKPFLLSSENIGDLLAYLPESGSSIRSGVLVPLRIHQILFGALFLGSIDADRYRPKDGTDLLEQLGIKIAICLDNCLTYERVKEFAIQDPLTGLLNFFQIHTVLEREFRRARRLKAPLSVLIIDLNFFHQIHGHFDMGILGVAAKRWRRGSERGHSLFEPVYPKISVQTSERCHIDSSRHRRGDPRRQHETPAGLVGCRIHRTLPNKGYGQ
jgi:hypothetical protein